MAKQKQEFEDLDNIETQSDGFTPNCGERKPLILAIDDDQDNLLFLSYILVALEYNCVTTRSSQEFLLLVKQLVPDLILLDIVLPEINGFDLIEQIKQDAQTAHIPIIAITGLAKTDYKMQVQQAGCDDYLIKPFLIEELEVILARYFY
ncbi:response regulator receiver protein [Stanieria sp. NIES-3757]|nr:response regulator receiver protein [Stanieria sp. NIES-3757]